MSELVIARAVFDLAKEGFRSLRGIDSWMRGKTKAFDLFDQGFTSYGDKLIKQVNQMQIFGQPKPKPLSDIYIHVNILKDLTYLQKLSADELQKAFGTDSRTLGGIRETKYGLEAVNEHERLTILGKPGAGKSTFLKLVTLYAITGQLGTKCLPILIILKDWSDSNATLFDYIVNQFEINDFPDAERFVKRMLKKGNCLVLFDGYDEVTEPEKGAVKYLRDFIDSYDKNRFILSCRIAAYHHTFEGFTLVEIADFQSQQIKKFIEKWFSEDSELGKKCWEKMSKNPAIKELASTPLLLTMLCVQFDEALDFPENRVELYEDATQALLKKWDTSRRIERRPVYKNLSVAGKESLLSYIAYNSFIKEEYFIPQRVLEARIREYIENIPGVEEKNLDLDSNRVLKAIEANHGLLVERASKVFSFSHLTFQEYYTARYFVQHQIQLQLIDERIFDPKWNEIILLASGFLTNHPVSDVFIQALRRSIRVFAKQKNLTGFLKIVFTLIKKSSPFTIGATRSLAVIEALAQGSRSLAGSRSGPGSGSCSSSGPCSGTGRGSRSKSRSGSRPSSGSGSGSGSGSYSSP